MTIKRLAPVLVVAVLAAAHCPAQSQNTEWEFVLTPYAFLPAVDADSTIAGQTTPIDLSFSDVLDNFDVMALYLRGEAWNRDNLGLVGDFMWTDLDGDFGPGDSVNVIMKQWYTDLLVGYRWMMDSETSRKGWTELTTGARYNSLKQTIEAAPLPAKPGGTETWIDWMIGGRVVYPVSDRWILVARGDVGGFDINDDADFTWSVTGIAGWQFASNWLLDVGYRYYTLDYAKYEGTPREFAFDGSQSGLWLGVTWAPQAN